MLKLLVAPLLLITMNSKKPIVIKDDFEKSPQFLEKKSAAEKAAKTKLFVHHLEHQLLYEPIEINYSLSGCFNFNYYRMTLSKISQEYFMKLYIIRAPDISIAEEQYFQNKGDSILLKLTPTDLNNLKKSLVVNRKRVSTMHNYISITQGATTYELMDDNPEHPLLYFIVNMEKGAKK